MPTVDGVDTEAEDKSEKNPDLWVAVPVGKLVSSPVTMDGILAVSVDFLVACTPAVVWLNTGKEDAPVDLATPVVDTDKVSDTPLVVRGNVVPENDESDRIEVGVGCVKNEGNGAVLRNEVPADIPDIGNVLVVESKFVLGVDSGNSTVNESPSCEAASEVVEVVNGIEELAVVGEKGRDSGNDGMRSETLDKLTTVETLIVTDDRLGRDSGSIGVVGTDIDDVLGRDSWNIEVVETPGSDVLGTSGDAADVVVA